jgi:hypothetical protein
MAKTVIAVHQLSETADCTQVREAVGAPPGQDLGMVRAFDCTPASAPIAGLSTVPISAGAVAQAGAHLLAKLCENPSVQSALTAAFNGPGPIYIDATAPRPQALPWEALCNAAGQFAALSGWPVARVISSPVKPVNTERTFDPPLRVLAVLAAAGVQTGAVPEARGIHQALVARRATLDFELRVLGCEEALQQEVAGWNDPAVQFSYLASAKQLTDLTEDWRPHLVHFFCHGIAGPNPRLELATRADAITGAARGSLRIEETDFQRMLDRHPALWLVALNCCLGAAATDGSTSLASRLVLMGYPLVVGMTEPIAADDAYVFSSSFLESTLRTLEEYLAQGDYRREVEWAGVLVEPREDLCSKYGGMATARDVKAWTLPVLHARPGRFELVGPRASAALTPEEVSTLAAKIQKLLEMRVQLAQIADLPAETISTLDQQIDELRLKLAPPGQ